MLRDNFFIIATMDRREGSCRVVLELNAGHEILKGHFPGHPVVPGACMMQMVKEIMETTLSRKLQLTRADQIKFLRMVDPGKSRVLEMLLTYQKLEEDKIKVAANLLLEAVVCFKFSGEFQML